MYGETDLPHTGLAVTVIGASFGLTNIMLIGFGLILTGLILMRVGSRKLRSDRGDRA